MLSKSQITHCKRVIHGSEAGDKLVSMVALQKSGIKVAKGDIAEARAGFSGSEDRIRTAYEVYDAFMAFINCVRRSNLKETTSAINQLVRRLNNYNEQSTWKWSVDEKTWVIIAGDTEFKYIKKCHNVDVIHSFYTFILNNCVDAGPLSRVYDAMNLNNT